MRCSLSEVEKSTRCAFAKPVLIIEAFSLVKPKQACGLVGLANALVWSTSPPLIKRSLQPLS